MPAGEIWCPSCWTRGLHSLSSHLPDFAPGCTQWSEGQEREASSGVTAEYHLQVGRLGSSGARWWEVSGGLGSPVVCGLSYPHCGRAVWPLRMCSCTSPGRSGSCWRNLRDSCTAMWCWRTLHTWPPWVSPCFSYLVVHVKLLQAFSGCRTAGCPEPEANAPKTVGGAVGGLAFHLSIKLLIKKKKKTTPKVSDIK